MAKQKEVSAKANQRKHNPQTRGINTTRRGVTWARRQRKVKAENGKEVTSWYTVEVPVGTLYDPWDRTRTSEHAQEPFDSLSLDWTRELVWWTSEPKVAIIDGEEVEVRPKVGKINLRNGNYLYRVYYGDSVRNPRVVFLEIESAEKLVKARSRREE